jgi:hypothetical protein
MSIKIQSGLFDIAKDSVTIRGAFNEWSGYNPVMKRTGPSDSIYSVTLAFADSLANNAKYDTIEYVYVMGGIERDNWENKNRRFVFKGNAVLPVVFFNDDSVLATRQTITYKINMTVAIQQNYFLPDAGDKVFVYGDNVPGGWNPGSQLTANPLKPGHYSVAIPINDYNGVAHSYIFHTTSTRSTGIPLPYGGYEQGWHNVNYGYMTTGSNLVLPEPFYNGSSAILTHDVTVIFSVDIKGAINARTGKVFPKADSVFVSGSNGNIGTTDPNIGWMNSAPWSSANHNKRMYDDGSHGDLVANDSTYSLKVKFLAGTGNDEKFAFNIVYNAGDTSKDHFDTLYVDQNERNTLYSQECHEFVVPDTGGVDLRLTTNKFGNYPDITSVDWNATGVTMPENLPLLYSLDQNYPNPFNPSTVIQYSIAKQGPVTLTVYDMLGREVETLFNGMQSAGVYNVNFDASRLSSGVYFYSLHAGSFFSVKKLLLLK